MIALARSRFTRGSRYLAVGAALALTATACAGGGGDAPSASPTATGAAPAAEGPLKLGTLLPNTGNLSFFGPPMTAGVDLAVKEINEAGGVNGEDVTVIHRDSGDTTTNIATQSVNEMLGQDVAAIIGAASSGVTKTVINQVTGSGTLMMSPANTSPDFSTWDDKGLYWRTAPSDVMQGRILGNVMVGQGAATVGMIVLNDAYGTGLAKNIRTAVEGANGEIVAESMFNEGDSQFSSQVDEVVGANPDAIAVLSFDQARSIIPLLIQKGVDPSTVYFVDGNILDYSKDFDKGTLEGAMGTQPGSFAKDDFKGRLESVNDSLKDWNYAAESYDAATLIALASTVAKSNDGAAIAAQLQAVSRDGEKCADFAACKKLLDEGKDIDYDGIAGPVTYDEKGDITEGIMGVYQYDGNNVPKPLREESGAV
ncbi:MULTISPECIES: ABC transporter substrate-binding protein [Paeniglutamicibacter]|uniref:Branched-chain amino acid transport system substrate-binding protein n=1 Tax=Paeniglutamicibacter sulfureus TaxID=43666 RepID=A0ABU2BG20_9MICC|nr:MULTISPECIES: ABC transporter substrate-binding protein [Paeniglutamicibacter]MCV9992969.1 ABC transporter substrate-binding protein [Paeniglutamicibacter sp. ZC-3]MDO2933253.1 ABC transporter substrate-binding protein [Paeniglutamicibacter sulfureus]MDR7357565.1 branched-chain amino acid transport system substrate-binding protein [Paeniglutamicibacter sulfureus]